MSLSTIFRTTLALTVSLGGVAVSPIQAIQLADGTVSFEKPPSLIKATTTFNETNVLGATYYFTVELPENAGEPLQRLTINQRQGLDDIRFKLEDSRAFEGTSRHKGERLTLTEVTKDPKTKTISVTSTPLWHQGKPSQLGFVLSVTQRLAVLIFLASRLFLPVRNLTVCI
jgi:hypothetical protein